MDILNIMRNLIGGIDTLKQVAYIRVSSNDQNIDRQYEQIKDLGIEEKHIYIDKASGKDFDRIGYQYMKRALEVDDILFIHSLDRFGRNYEDIIREWNDITKNIKADIKVLDMELLDTTKHKDLLGNFISDLVLQVLSFVAQKERKSIRQRQREGIDTAKLKGVKFGRPKKEVDLTKFKNVYDIWKSGEITAVKAMNILDLTKATFYRKVKEYENNKF